jgi:hypothetical protein
MCCATCLVVCCCRFEDPWARVISGTEEGMYGWLALNYEQGLLQQQLAAAPSQPTAAPAAAPVTLGILGASTSLGALDLGGSSLEMTHEVLPSSSSSSSSTSHAAARQHGMQNVTVAGHTFHLHTHTFRRYGLNEAFDRSVTLLLEQQQQQQHPEQAANLTQLPEQLQQVEPSASPQAAAAADNSSGDTGAPTAQPNLPADAALAHQAQVDLAVAAAAGLKPHTPGYKVPAAGSSTGSQILPVSGGSSSSEAAAAAHQVQADLAVAAAAGFHPKTAGAAPMVDGPHKDAGDPVPAYSLPHLSSSGSSTGNSSSIEDVLQQQRIQADLAVAAAAGLRPQFSVSARNHSTVASSSSSSQEQRSDPPGTPAVILNAANDLSRNSSSGGSAGASVSQPKRLAAGLQALADTDSTSHTAVSSSSDSMHSAVSVRQAEHRALHSRDRRHKQRRMRQLLLQQHKYLEPDELMHWAAGSNYDLAVAATSHSSKRGSISSDRAALQHSSSAGLGVTQAFLEAHLQGLWRRLLVHSSASAAAPGATRPDQQEQPDPPTQPSSSSSSSSNAEPLSSTAGNGSNATASTSAAPAASSNALSTSAAGSIHPPQLVADRTGSVSAAPIELSTAAGVHTPEVWHPCLNEGFSAKYDRLAYDGTAPAPSQVGIVLNPLLQTLQHVQRSAEHADCCLVWTHVCLWSYSGLSPQPRASTCSYSYWH